MPSPVGEGGPTKLVDEEFCQYKLFFTPHPSGFACHLPPLGRLGLYNNSELRIPNSELRFSPTNYNLNIIPSNNYLKNSTFSFYRPTKAVRLGLF